MTRNDLMNRTRAIDALIETAVKEAHEAGVTEPSAVADLVQGAIRRWCNINLKAQTRDQAVEWFVYPRS